MNARVTYYDKNLKDLAFSKDRDGLRTLFASIISEYPIYTDQRHPEEIGKLYLRLIYAHIACGAIDLALNIYDNYSRHQRLPIRLLSDERHAAEGQALFADNIHISILTVILNKIKIGTPDLDLSPLYFQFACNAHKRLFATVNIPFDENRVEALMIEITQACRFQGGAPAAAKNYFLTQPLQHPCPRNSNGYNKHHKDYQLAAFRYRPNGLFNPATIPVIVIPAPVPPPTTAPPRKNRKR